MLLSNMLGNEENAPYMVTGHPTNEMFAYAWFLWLIPSQLALSAQGSTLT
jgi:hypothetical protein